MGIDVEEAFIVTYQIKDKVLIRMFKPDKKSPVVVHGFKSEREALDYFEKGYAEAHRRGGGWSAGAMIMDMQTRPRVHHTTLSEITELVGPNPMLHKFSGDGMWGEMGLLCQNNERTRAFRKAGKVPDLTGGSR